MTEPLSILGAMLTGRPVRYVIGREEEMIYCAPRGAERIFIKDGVIARRAHRRAQVPLPISTAAPIRGFRATRWSNAPRICPAPTRSPTSHADVYCVFTNRVPATAMRGFGVTAVDFAIECQMDKLAHLVGMDPMEFRILNAYRDGDMKAHRREAKNTALIECVQVAAEKAKWRIRDEFKRVSSRKDGGGARAAVPRDAARADPSPAAPAGAAAHELRPRAAAAARAGCRAAAAAPAPAAAGGRDAHGATRFSSVFGRRR